MAVRQKFARGDCLDAVHRQCLQPPAALDRVQAMQNEELAAGHNSRIGNKVVVQVCNRKRCGRTGQRIGGFNLQPRSSKADNRQIGSLLRLVADHQDLTQNGRARPIRRQRCNVSRERD